MESTSPHATRQDDRSIVDDYDGQSPADVLRARAGKRLREMIEQDCLKPWRDEHVANPGTTPEPPASVVVDLACNDFWWADITVLPASIVVSVVPHHIDPLERLRTARFSEQRMLERMEWLADRIASDREVILRSEGADLVDLLIKGPVRLTGVRMPGIEREGERSDVPVAALKLRAWRLLSNNTIEMTTHTSWAFVNLLLDVVPRETFAAMLHWAQRFSDDNNGDPPTRDQMEGALSERGFSKNEVRALYSTLPAHLKWGRGKRPRRAESHPRKSRV